MDFFKLTSLATAMALGAFNANAADCDRIDYEVTTPEEVVGIENSCTESQCTLKAAVFSAVDDASSCPTSLQTRRIILTYRFHQSRVIADL